MKKIMDKFQANEMKYFLTKHLDYAGGQNQTVELHF